MYARDNGAAASRLRQPRQGAAGRGGATPAADISPAQVAAAVTALQMLAEPTRLRLMWHLTGGEYDVGTLTAALGVARPAVSQHLAKLRLAGLVTTRRDGRRALYKASGGHVRRLVTEVLNAADHQVTGRPDLD